jgi:SAM-dependent methyltransferase
VSPGPAVDAEAYWAATWRQKQDASFLKRSQLSRPDRWRKFYDRVPSLWGELNGAAGGIGRKVSECLLRRGSVETGGSALDIGCGPGGLSLALAAKGVRVTALDRSVGMIRSLEDRIRRENVSGVRPVLCDWLQYRPARVHDLAMACFFPDACNPEGVRLLEELGGKACALVLGRGGETFPVRRRIWEAVMESPVPDGGFHLGCARGFLESTGRQPDVDTLSVPALVEAEALSVEIYFRSYFSIFGKDGPKLVQAVRDALAPYRRRDRVCLEGNADLAVLSWWPPQSPHPIGMRTP